MSAKRQHCRWDSNQLEPVSRLGSIQTWQKKKKKTKKKEVVPTEANYLLVGWRV